MPKLNTLIDDFKDESNDSSDNSIPQENKKAIVEGNFLKKRYNSLLTF